ncbi:MAG TPA: DUF4215 domain-containing protein, partial [Nannocystaceae bacterium]|nr:DUF4215 domain-containing protein [Nannocystaceae bacterium]
YCGDGIVQPPELCDDANASNTDACLTTCQLAACGDGFLHDKIEECDDGNLDPDDGCNHLCARDRLVFITEEAFGPPVSAKLSPPPTTNQRGENHHRDIFIPISHDLAGEHRRVRHPA